MPSSPNPILPGFNPDPSIVAVDGWYYLATSSFEYLPGLPIYRSRDLVVWDVIGHVVTRPGQLQMDNVPTGGGAFAPTLRHRDGVFYLVVTDAMGRGTLIFTTEDPSGPWSDGLVVASIEGIDPDLAWDDDGTCFMTYSGLVEKPESGEHQHGIKQIRIDLETGEALEETRVLWSGTGLMFPEAPHLYHIGEWWYLLIAEGGTERGHAISIARSASPAGPFVGDPANPILSAAGTARQVQNTGHADFIQCFDGSWKAVLLGMHTRGETRAFSPLGRQTFITNVAWIDHWPVLEVPQAGPPAKGILFEDCFESNGLGPEWVAIRQMPTDVSEIGDGCVSLRGLGRSMGHTHPVFLGVRQQQLCSTIEAEVSIRDGVGGLTLRYDENHHFDVEVNGDQVTARACLATISTSKSVTVPDGPIILFMAMSEPEPGSKLRHTGDLVSLGWIDSDGASHEIAEFDGRFLSAETTCSFTGRVAGLYCSEGQLAFSRYTERA